MKTIARTGAYARGALVLLALAGQVADASAQRYIVLPEPGGTAVGLAIVVQAGSPWELASEAGLSYLAALATIDAVRPSLEALGGHAEAICLRAGMAFTLLLPRTTWLSGTRLFLDALFHDDLPDDAIERARTSLLRRLEAQDAFTPAVHNGLLRALLGTDNRWTRPPCGSIDAVTTLSAQDVRRLRRSRFRPAGASAAIAGPVDESDALEILSEFVVDDDLPILVPAPAVEPREGHVSITRPTVTTWIALAFPFPESTDTEALRLLAFLLREELGPSRQRPDVYDFQTQIERHGSGGWLTVTLITESDRATRREAEVRARVKQLAEKRLSGKEFDALLVRFRGTRLLELATPEARALDAALQLFFGPSFRKPTIRSEDLNPRQLRDAAAALAAPASASLGPR